MSRSRSSNGINELFSALMVNHRKSAQPYPNASQSSDISLYRRTAHEPVVGVDRDPELQVLQPADRVLGDGRGGAGLHVRRGAQLQRDALVPDVGGEPAELPVTGDVVDDAYAVAEAVGAAPLDRLP